MTTRVTHEPALKHDRLSLVLFTFSLFLLAVAAFIYFVNPLTRLALSTASLAQPARLRDIPNPKTVSGDWCLSGDFIDDGSLPKLVDSGTQGDGLADDRVYSIDYTISQPGSYLWHVFHCTDPTLIYPSTNTAWIQTDRPGQSVTFIFDANERDDSHFFPNTFALNAIDSTEAYRAVGDFQGWNIEDPSALLKRSNNGLFQQAMQIALPGTYQGYVIEEDEWKAIDAYGRTYDPISFVFTTSRNNEYVVFLLDTDRGGATVYANIPPIIGYLAFGLGSTFFSLIAAGISGLFMISVLVRQWVFHNRQLWLDSGCPRCGQHELLRIPRLRSDKLWHLVKIPAYRYHCHSCTWEGLRLRIDP